MRGGGAHMCQCICMQMLETPERLPDYIVESIVDIWNRIPGSTAV